MDKRFWAIIGVIVAVFVGILLFSGGDKTDNGDSGDGKTKPTNHVRGNTESKVTLVEYGDFQCPYCGLFNPIVEEVVEKYEDKIAFQYRHYPLTQIHKNALAAARAAEAADEQDKFWEMHSMLFKNQGDWSENSNAPEIFEAYAKQLGLNITKFKEDFSSSKVNARINADRAEFNKTKLTPSTPTFILNGKKITPEATVDSLSKFIDEALEKQN
jgi:protein-disulfide isomerase